jgi:eukaryotic-like serine/threonine-protein kinase
VTTVPAPIGVVAHYNLLERLDPSGPGELFRARDTHRGRTVAIRLLPHGFESAGASGEALVEQARSLVPLSHPNIVTLFDAGEHEGRTYLAFEFVKGQSLRAEMAGRPMPPRRAVGLAIQIADAVAEAHAAGFLHAGLSPDSVMVTDRGHAKIPTFHLASQTGFDDERGGATLHDYGSPEESRGETADDRADVYSIGAVAYELLTTRRPSLRGASAPSRSNARVPAELDAVILEALSPTPDNRPQSAALFAAGLRALLPALEAADADEEEPPTARRSTGATFIAAALALIVLAAVVVAWWVTAS